MSIDIYIYISAISISLITNCILVFSQKTALHIKGFFLFLFLSLLVELFTTYLAAHNKSTIPFYNFSSITEIVFYSWILYQILRSHFLKKVITICMIGYPIISVIEISLLESGNFHSITYSIGCIIIIFFSIAYFYELFTKPTAVILSNEPNFWITTGLLLFYSVSFPLFASTNLIKLFPPLLSNNIRYLLVVLNVFLYLLFSIAFLCRITIKKS